MYLSTSKKPVKITILNKKWETSRAINAVVKLKVHDKNMSKDYRAQTLTDSALRIKLK